MKLFQILIIPFCCLIVSSASAQSAWSIFRGNQQLSGTTSANIPEKPKLLFSFQTGDDIKASPVVSGQTIYCGSTYGSMYAVGFDGKLKWKFESGNAIEAPALLLSGSVVFGTLDGLFFRLDEKTGKQIWKYKTDNQIMGSAKVKIHIPLSIKEQNSIVQILTDMDNEITQLEADQNKYKHIKAGMMQQLLTGKIRLVNCTKS